LAAFFLGDRVDILDTNRHTSLSIYNFVQNSIQDSVDTLRLCLGKELERVSSLFKCDFDELNDIRLNIPANQFLSFCSVFNTELFVSTNVNKKLQWQVLYTFNIIYIKNK